MARKRGNSTMQEAAAAAAAAAVAASREDLAPLLEDDVESIEVAEDVLEGLRRLDQGNRVTWYVYSDTPGESEGYIEKIKTEHLDEQRFKSRYGPGEYRVLGRTNDGHYVKGSHKTVKISDIGADGSRGQANDAVSLLREMRAADEQRAAKRAEDLRSYTTILATPLATVAAALIARRPALDVPALIAALRPQQSTLTEMTSALTHLRALEGGTNNVDMVLKLLERVQDLPSGNGDTGWLSIVRDVIREAAPAARDLLGQLQRPAGQLPAGAVAGPAFGPGLAPALPPKPTGTTPPQPILSGPSHSSPGAPPSTATPTAGPPSEQEAMLQLAEPWLRRRAADLHEWAGNNLDTELCAEMLMASVPKAFRDFIAPADLRGLLVRPDWWQHLTQFHPALTPYHAWIDDLRQELVSMLDEDLQSAAETHPTEQQQP